MQRKWLMAVLLCVLSFQIHAQGFGKNIPRYEYRKWVFGTALGFNSTSYKYTLNPNPEVPTTVTNLQINSRPGLSIQLPLVSYNPHHAINFRIKPYFAFHETEFVYQYFDSNGRLDLKTTRTEPTVLGFPIYMKFNTMRINNFSAFAIGGMSYAYDLSSQKDVVQTPMNPIIKMTPHDWQYHVGGGFDFYLPYFKFGLEIKTSRGVNNLLIQDNTFFSTPLSSLKTRVWWFSITFEV